MLFAAFATIWTLLAGPAWTSPLDQIGSIVAWDALSEDTVNATAMMFARGPGDPVPGNATIHHCQNSGQDEIAVFDSIDMTPQVLRKNADLNVTVSGQLRQLIEDGAMLEIKVKYSVLPVPIVRRKYPLCEMLKHAGISCPIPAGALGFNKTWHIPNTSIPPGRYHINVNAYTKDKTPIVCLNIDQRFKR
ncbi:hypothetical protein OPQ81_005038 [Rhizoctonia solani]|nr:hypothetical protein OPQ81_005038 [Rhizoctonia solani]